MKPNEDNSERQYQQSHQPLQSHQPHQSHPPHSDKFEWLAYARFVRYVRPLAYSNEVGEAFRHAFPKLLVPSYVLGKIHFDHKCKCLN